MVRGRRHRGPGLPMALSAGLLLGGAGPAPVAARDPPKGGSPFPGGQGLPGGLGGGPPWRKAIDKVFSEACSLNKGANSVFCFPEKKALLEALQVEQYGLDMTGETYLMDVYVVMNQLLQWPPAWSLLSDVFDTKEPWTRPFCDKIMGSPWWRVVPLVRKSFIVPRATFAQLEKDMPIVAVGMKRWFDTLRASGNSKTQQLLQMFKDSDSADAKSRRCSARPLMRLMMQQHAKAIQHIFGVACKGSKPALDKLQQTDTNGLTVLHHVASLGDEASAKAILKAIPKSARAEFAARRDNGGYSAEDWARLGDFGELVEILRDAATKGDGKRVAAKATAGTAVEAPPAETSAALRSVAEPLSNFPAVEDDDAAQCSSESMSPSCRPLERGSGGWRPPVDAAVPSEWLPAVGQSCEFDTIEVERFNETVFLQHYLLHPRPLLIKGGARLPANIIQNFTKEGLLAVAGDRKVELMRFSTEREFDGSKPQVKSLKDYVGSLEQRPEEAVPKKLHFMHDRLLQEESYLNFSATLPPLLGDQVSLIATTFFLGGSMMGVPPHHKSPTVATLVFGRLLWLMEPPGREFLSHDTAYQHFARSVGARGARKCVQEAGDLLYAPRHWTQSWVCLGDCVGMTHEFTSNWWDLRD